MLTAANTLIADPNITMVLGTVLDPVLERFLEKFAASGHLETTATLVLSDHGLHYGPCIPSWVLNSGIADPPQSATHMHVPPDERDRLPHGCW